MVAEVDNLVVCARTAQLVTIRAEGQYAEDTLAALEKLMVERVEGGA